MKSFLARFWPVPVVAIFIVGLLCVTLKPYHGNPSALFHLDHLLADQHVMPSGFIVLGVPAYDGAQYYQIARNIPLIFSPQSWPELAAKSPGSYAYQRILLPLTAWLVSAGQQLAFPYTFLAINIVCLLAVCTILLLKKKKSQLYALTLALCPAAMVGLHFSLAEPLTLLLLVVFLLRYDKKEELSLLDAGLLSLLVLAREVNILFVGLLFLYTLWKRKWSALPLLCLPVLSFLAWHAAIYGIFHDIPFIMSAEKKDLPFATMLRLITGYYGYNRLTLTSIPLALLLFPTLFWIVRNSLRERDIRFLPLAAIAFILLMSVMPDHIWGSITSIGRVITPVYPLLLIYAAHRNTLAAKCITLMILLIGIGAGLSLALVVHPFEIV